MEYSDFLVANPIYIKGEPYAVSELANLNGKAPADLIDFLKTFGHCSFINGFLSTVYPYEIDSKTVFKKWGFKKGDYYIFLRTCFGVCVFFYDGNYYYLNPQEGYYGKLGDDWDLIINGMLTTDLFIDVLFKNEVYKGKWGKMPKLGDNEIYMLVPPIPFGGSFETSKFEPGDVFVHLCFLADLYENKVRKL